MRPGEPALATFLCDDRVVELERIPPDANDTPDAVWIHTGDLPRVNNFEVKPEGACRGDLCIPLAADMTRGGAFNLTAFAKKTGQAVVAEPAARAWSFGEMQLSPGTAPSRIAPDVTVPDRLGRPVHLAGFRGKKVLVITWASW